MASVNMKSNISLRKREYLSQDTKSAFSEPRASELVIFQIHEIISNHERSLNKFMSILILKASARRKKLSLILVPVNC